MNYFKNQKFSRQLYCLYWEIWRYMVNSAFYWDIGFLGKLKSKIRKATILPEYANLALYGEFRVLLGYRVFEKIKIKNS